MKNLREERKLFVLVVLLHLVKLHTLLFLAVRKSANGAALLQFEEKENLILDLYSSIFPTGRSAVATPSGGIWLCVCVQPFAPAMRDH